MMATAKQTTGTSRRPIKHLRWWIGGLLFTSTVINYIDRQTFSVLGPYLKIDYHWNNEQFALIVISFRVAYSIGQTVSGRFIDRIGTRKGLTITVIWYSIAAMLTSFAVGLRSFAFFRFLWLIAWRWLYYPPEKHPRISDDERRMILDDRQEQDSAESSIGSHPAWK